MKKQLKNTQAIQTQQGFFQNKRLQLILISLFIFFMYARTVSYEYIGLDDTTLIETNYKFIKNFSNILTAFTKHVMYSGTNLDNEKDYYRPMLTLSFMIDAHIAGNAKPRWYHFANILYHLTACLLLFVLLSKLKVNPITTFLLTLLFSIHPVVDQAVAWIPGRNDTLLAIFVLSSFIFLLKYIQTKEFKDLVWHVVFFGCALFTKENGIMLSILCLGYLGLIAKDSFKSTWLKLSLGYLLFSIPWFFLRKIAIEGSTTDNSLHAVISNFLNNVPFILQYIGKVILPFNLSVMCMMEDVNYIQVIIALLIIAAAIFFSKNKRWSFILFGLGWFIIFLAPSFSARLVEGLEHRLYVPIIGFIIITAETDWMKNLSTSNKKIWIAPVIYIAALLWITNSRLDIFRNRFNFNISAMQTSQYSVVPCVNLAGDYDIVGKLDKSIEMYKTALKRDSVYGVIHPTNRVSYYTILHDNLGVIYTSKQMYKEAEQEFALAVKQDDVYAIYHMANVYFKTDRIEQAVPLWKKVIAKQPKQPEFKDVYLRLAQYAKDKKDTTSFNYYVNEFKKFGH
ncbi:MAG TPA: glycosyltransferase family 39 protein [Bacteroidia bacterium]|nr:glycosyltransferase family 39 protein [Bacteroidia bacterium]